MSRRIIQDMAKKKDNTAEIGFEEQIWSAADKLRGNTEISLCLYYV